METILLLLQSGFSMVRRQAGELVFYGPDLILRLGISALILMAGWIATRSLIWIIDEARSRGRSPSAFGYSSMRAQEDPDQGTTGRRSNDAVFFCGMLVTACLALQPIYNSPLTVPLAIAKNWVVSAVHWL